MRRTMATLAALSWLLLVLGGPVWAQGPVRARLAGLRQAPQELVVRFKPGAGMASVQAAVRASSARPAAAIPELNARLMRLPADRPLAEAMAALRKLPDVVYVEPNYVVRAALVAPDDPNYSAIDPDTGMEYQWALHTINALAAWSIYPNTYYTSSSKPSDPPKVAVVDTGVDETHPDWKNAGGTSVDAASGGQLDWADRRNTIYGAPDPSNIHDGYHHGTFVSGIIAASANNGASASGKGIAGLGYHCQLMPIKALDDDGYGTDWEVGEGIIWAANHGALVINCSLSGYEYSQVMQDAVNHAWSEGSLVVAAAGNDAMGFPANYPAACDKVLGVAATGSGPLGEYVASYSNFGYWVGITAPGGDFDSDLLTYVYVFSMLPSYDFPGRDPSIGVDYYYGYAAGTSASTPFVSALASLYAAYKGITQATPGGPQQIMTALQRGCENLAGTGYWNPYVGWGRIDAQHTLLEDNYRDATMGGLRGQVLLGGTISSGAYVTATPSGGGTSIAVSTKLDGTYRFEKILPGTYDVRATAMTYTGLWTGVVVVAGADTVGISFSLDPPPLAVEVCDLALRSDGRRPLLSWRTGAGQDLALFRVWAAGTPEGPYALLDEVPGEGTVGGGEYAVCLARPERAKARYYKLEAVHYDGSAEYYGPVTGRKR